MGYKINLTDEDRADLDKIIAHHRFLRHRSEAIQFAIQRTAEAIGSPQPPPPSNDDLSEAQCDFRDDLGQVMLDDAQLAALERVCDTRQMNAYEVVTEIIGTYIVDFLGDEDEDSEPEPTVMKKLVKF